MPTPQSRQSSRLAHYALPWLFALVPNAQATEAVQQLATVDVTDSTLQDDTGEEPTYSRFSLPKSVKAVQTLDQEDIAAIRPRDVVDLIENSLGLSIRRQGARVHNFTYSRGDNVSIILDGVYLTATTAQRVLGDIPPEAIENIQFLRDASVITIGPLMGFGSANAGSPNQGFIMIKTRKHKPDADHTTEVKTSYATYDTWKASAYTSQSLLDDKLGLSGGYQHSASHGKPDWNNDYAFDTYLLSGRYDGERFAADSSLYVNRGWRNIQRSVGIYEGTPPNDNTTALGQMGSSTWRYDPMDTLVLSLGSSYFWNDANTTHLTLGYSRATGTNYRYYTYLDNSTVAGLDAEDWAKEWALSHTLVTGNNLMKLGLQGVEWYQRSEGSALANQEQIYGLALSDELALTDRLLLDGALRMDKKKVIHSSTKYLDNGSEVKMREGQWTDDAYLASLGLAWQYNPVYRLSSRYAFNYTPTPDTLTTRNNKRLAAEQRHRIELGLSADWNPALRLNLTPFYYYLKNAKVSDGTITVEDHDGTESSITVYTLDDTVIRKGVELGLSGRFANNTLGYELGWSHFYSSADNATTDFPDNKYNVRLNWAQGNWDGNANLLRVDPYMSNDYEVGDFTTLNLSLAYQLTPDATLTLFGENVTNQHYGTMNKGSVQSVQNGGRSACWGVVRDVGATYGIEAAMRF